MSDKQVLNEKLAGNKLFFDPPLNNTKTIEIYRCEYKEGEYVRVASLPAIDAYGNAVSEYEDSLAAVTDWYKIRFVSSTGSYSESDPVRAVRIFPIKLYFSEPPLEDRDIIDILILRSITGIDGPYVQIEKFRARDEFGVFKNVWTDINGSEEFYYKVQYLSSKWDIINAKSILKVSEESDPVSGLDLSKQTLTLGLNLSVNFWTNIESIPTKEYKQCGYHRFSPEDYFCKGASSPYSRNWSGDCAMDPYQESYERLLLMLQATGSAVTLYRRKWEGEACKCVDRVREHAIKKCEICFGTNYVGGYDEYHSDYREDGLILVRFSPFNEEITTHERGFTQNASPSGWTLSKPRIRERDFIITYDPIALKDGELLEQWRYVVASVEQNNGFCALPYSQKFTLNRLDRTDIIYEVGRVTVDKDKYYSDNSSMRNLRSDAPNQPRKGR